MKKIVCAILSAVILLSIIISPVGAENSNFLNISPWAEAEVMQAKDLELIPEEMLDDDLCENITRAEFAAVAVKLLEKLTGKEAAVDRVLISDIDENEYFTYIIKAYITEITTGTSNSPVTFSPDMNITRQQLATMLGRTVKKAAWEEWSLLNDEKYDVDYNIDSEFEDSALISDYAVESVYFMAKHGVAKGMGNNIYAPDASATKEQAILMALRCYNEFSKDEALKEMYLFRLTKGNEPEGYQQIFIDYAKNAQQNQLNAEEDAGVMFTDLNGDGTPEMFGLTAMFSYGEIARVVLNNGFYIHEGNVTAHAPWKENNTMEYSMAGLPETVLMIKEDASFQGTFVNKKTKDPQFVIHYGDKMYIIDYIENEGFVNSTKIFNYDACREFISQSEPIGYSLCQGQDIEGAVIKALGEYEQAAKDKENEKAEIPENVDYSYAASFTIATTEDVAEARKYDTIRYLKIDSAFISDFSFLKDIKIEMLQVLYNYEPLDMAHINEKYLKQLYLVDVPYINEQEISGFENLTHFTIKNNNNIKSVENFNFLSECLNITNVEIQNYGIKNLDFAKKLKKLKELSVINSSIEDISGIAGCTNLESLILSRSKISDISCLENLKNIKVLDLSDNYIKSTDALSGLLKLEHLALKHNDLSEITDLGGLSNLDQVDLSNNYITDFPEELLFPEGALDVSYNNIKSLSEEEISAIERSQNLVNLFDNMVDIDTLSRVSYFPNVNFTAAGSSLTPKEAMAYSKKVQEILPELNKGTQQEQVMRVVKYVVDNCEIDYSFKQLNRDNAYGALFEKVVCGGTTDLTNSLCRHLGIRTRRYNGDMTTTEDMERHVWSLVYIDGKFYHCDAMQSMGSNKDENKFPLLVLLSDEEISEFGHILDALGRFEITEGITKAQRAEIINNIMMQ